MSSHLFEDPPDIRNWHSSYVYESPLLDSLCKNTDNEVTKAVHSDLQPAGSKMIRQGVKPGRMQVEAAEIVQPNTKKVVHTSPASRGGSFRHDRNDLGMCMSQLPFDEVGSEDPSEEMNGTLHSKVRKVRGPTALEDIQDLPDGTRLPITWNSKGEPSGKYRSKFASFCGIIARDPSYAPLQVDKFYSIPKKMKTDMVERVCARFDIDSESDTVKSLVLSSIGKKYSDHLSRLKTKYFLKRKTFEERLHNLPPDMDKQDWEYLVNKWSSEKHKVLSEKNSKSRELAEVRHTSGTVSHGNVFDDETKKNGVTPTSYGFFRKVYTHKSDGTSADPKTARIISLVEEAAKVDVGRTTTSVCKDTIFNAVRGPVKKKSRTKCIDELTRRLEETEAARQVEKAAKEYIQNKYDSLAATIQNTGSNSIDSDETQEG